MGNLIAGIDGWLTANPADVILLHAGEYDFQTNAVQVDQILTAIQGWSDTNRHPLTVFNARIVDHHPTSPYPDTVALFNQAVDTLLANQWPDVIPVDLNAALDPSRDIADTSTDVTGLHPNRRGYRKVAGTTASSRKVYSTGVTKALERAPGATPSGGFQGVDPLTALDPAQGEFTQQFKAVT